MQNTVVVRNGAEVIEARISFNVPSDETRAHETDGWHATIGTKTITRGHATREACIAALRATWTNPK